MARIRKPQAMRPFTTGQGLPSLASLLSEVMDMTAVLKGDKPPPIQEGLMTLMEVADGYFARASEITILIQAAEREGRVKRGSPHYKFRTGELRTFMEMARKAFELGSRRLTHANLRHEQTRRGREAL